MRDEVSKKKVIIIALFQLLVVRVKPVAGHFNTEEFWILYWKGNRLGIAHLEFFSSWKIMKDIPSAHELVGSCLCLQERCSDTGRAESAAETWI